MLLKTLRQKQSWQLAFPRITFSTGSAQVSVDQPNQELAPSQGRSKAIQTSKKAKKQSPQKVIIKMQTIHEKMEDVEIEPTTGVVTHSRLLSLDGLSRRTFPSIDVFNSWIGSQRRKINQDLKQKLTPLQYYVTQSKGNERPFTGAFWETKDVGMYSCVVCTQRLFMFDHKFLNTSGFPTFWNGIKDAVKFEEDHPEVPESTNSVEDPVLQYKTPIKRCTCSNCEAHLGHLYADGPNPLGLRFQINSAALNFHKKAWFEIPKLDKVQTRKVQVEKQRSLEGLKQFQELLDDEKALGFDSYHVREKIAREKQAAIKAEPSKQAIFDVKGQQSKI